MIKTVEDILPQNLAEQVYSIVESYPYKYGWFSQPKKGYAHWNHDTAKAGGKNRKDVSDRLEGPVAEAWKHISSTLLNGEYTLIRCYANAHTFGVEGYSHTDSSVESDLTLVLYMNKEWDKDWGGETMVYEGNDILVASLPGFNKCLLFSSYMVHCARGLTRICPTQRRTLMFKVSKKEPIDPIRLKLSNFLESVGAQSKNHTKGTLTEHLLRTYDLLKEKEVSEATMIGGGLHSVFGTNAFKDCCLSLEDLPKVESEMGKEEARLAVLFSVLKRPSTLEKPNGLLLETTRGTSFSVTKEELTSLQLIECANLLDQNQLDKYPNLKTLWENT